MHYFKISVRFISSKFCLVRFNRIHKCSINDFILQYPMMKRGKQCFIICITSLKFDHKIDKKKIASNQELFSFRKNENEWNEKKEKKQNIYFHENIIRFHIKTRRKKYEIKFTALQRGTKQKTEIHINTSFCFCLFIYCAITLANKKNRNTNMFLSGRFKYSEFSFNHCCLLLFCILLLLLLNAITFNSFSFIFLSFFFSVLLSFTSFILVQQTQKKKWKKHVYIL